MTAALASSARRAGSSPPCCWSCCAVLPLLTQAFDQRYLLSIGTRIVIWAIAAVSLNMILGYGGLVSFGHAVFFGIGGLRRRHPVASRCRRTVGSSGPSPSSGRRCGPPWSARCSLRTRGLYFIMITLAFAQLVFYVGGGLEAYGADDGLNISRSRFPGVIDLRDKASFYWLCFALLCGTLWFCSRFRQSRASAW